MTDKKDSKKDAKKPADASSAPGRKVSERSDRIKKIDLIREKTGTVYSDSFKKTHEISEARNLSEGEKTETAGRIVSIREMGKMAFMHIVDFSGKIQVVIKSDKIGESDFKDLFKIVDVGDFIGVTGEIFKTQKGEISILLEKYQFLSKALRPLPEKWHGLVDVETKYRKRYLDLISNEDTKERFKFRSNFIKELRQFYWENGFYEIDTPALLNSASGALALPFKTHYNALDLDVYLRIAPEIHLKETIIGGFEKIFEVARVFRNEGMDASHLQEFSMVEHYVAYWTFEDSMKFTEQLLKTVIQRTMGTLKIQIPNRNDELVDVDLDKKWKVASFRDLLIADCGIDIDKFTDAKSLATEIKKNKIEIDDIDKLGRGNLIDSLYKKVSRPKLVEPTFLINHPIDLSPLARRNDKNPHIADRYQLVMNGWEIVNAYSELIDPIDQKNRFDEQGEAKKKGDAEALAKDDEYVEAMEYGMPPIQGFGMGIERIVALLTKQPNLRDVVMFPLLKPEK